MGRLSLKVVGSFLGNCFIITDEETKKNIEVMSKQLQGIISSDRTAGSLPHADWTKEGDDITIIHGDDSHLHEVTFTTDEVVDLLSQRREEMNAAAKKGGEA